MLHPRVETAFGDVIACWLRYDDARRSRVELSTLATLRVELDRLRERMHDVRRAHHPNQDELSEMAFAAFCDALGATVFISYRSVDGETYRCHCGSVAEVPPQPIQSSQAP